jgi:hypothetical protein
MIASELVSGALLAVAVAAVAWFVLQAVVHHIDRPW